MAICNMDCFNCQFADCINDRLEVQDFESDQYDEVSHSKKLSKARSDRYRALHKEVLNERSRKWNSEHAERVRETTQKWNRENKQRIAAKKRERWASNPDYYRQKQREYRARKKMQAAVSQASGV